MRRIADWSFAARGQGLSAHYEWDGGGQDVSIAGSLVATLSLDRNRSLFCSQVFKMGLTRTALEADQQHRYFTAVLALLS